MLYTVQAVQRGDDEPDHAANHRREGRDSHVLQGKRQRDKQTDRQRQRDSETQNAQERERARN